jgi:hypothetical protein
VKSTQFSPKELPLLDGDADEDDTAGAEVAKIYNDEIVSLIT